MTTEREQLETCLRSARNLVSKLAAKELLNGFEMFALGQLLMIAATLQGILAQDTVETEKR
jgi:hypothetical protein